MAAGTGDTVTRTSVPPVRVVFEESDLEWIFEELRGVLSSGKVAGGSKVEELERFWAEYTRCAHAVAVSNGGAALAAIVEGLGVRGKDVLVPTNTFIATATAVLQAGGRPVFLDTDPATLSVRLQEIQAKRTPDTVGVIVVHIGGMVTPEIQTMAEWCRTNGLWLVEDAAHAHGSEYEGRRAGEFGIAAAYSFFATKVITSGEGGMVVTDDEALAAFCRSFRDYGKRSQWESFHTIVSPNCRMSDIAAVIGLQQSRRLDEFIAWRERIASRYTQALTGVVDLVLPRDRSSWYKYVVVLPPGADREAFKAAMKKRDVALPGGVYDLPLHLQPVFAHLGLQGTLPAAEDICARHVCLPIFFGMSEGEAEQVIAAVREAVGSR